MSRYSPSGNCCRRCILVSDFSTAANVVSGTWGTNGTYYESTADGTVTIKSVSVPLHLTFKFEGDTVGQVIDVVFFGNTHGASGITARITLGDATTCGAFELFDESGVSISPSPSIASWLRIGEEHDFHACVSATRIIAGVDGGTGPNEYNSQALDIAPPDGTWVAISTTTQGGVIRFESDGIRLSREEDAGAGCEDCEPCTTAHRPISGICAWQTANVPQRCDETVTTHLAASVIRVDNVTPQGAVVTAWDRVHGYRVTAEISIPTLQTQVDLVTIALDGGAHKVVFQWHGFLNVAMYRGATLLKQKLNLGFSSGTRRFEVSLQGDRFCAGVGQAGVFGPQPVIPLIQTTTTSTHNGAAVNVDLGVKFSATEILTVDVTRCPACPGCVECDETPTPIHQEHTDSYQVVLPSFTYGLTTFVGGTWICQYIGGCVWEYRDNGSLIKVWPFGTAFVVEIYGSGGPIGGAVFTRFVTAALPQPTVCDDIIDEITYWSVDPNYTGKLTAL